LSTSADNSGSLQLATNNGTTAVTIDTSQNVGIGTTSPSSFAGKLVVNGGVSLLNSNRLYLWSPSNGFAPAIYAPSESIAFTDNNGVETFRVGSTGVLTLKGGNNAASGAGITFPATQSASSDANTLDDYEEGTFTVSVRGSNTAGTYTISSQTCAYVKIGRLVSVSIAIGGFSAATGGAGYMQITGMPFTNSFAVAGTVQGNNLDFNASTLYSIVDFISSSGQTILYFRDVRDNANGADFSIAGISTSTAGIIINLTYFTST
jgi:hypothetical protein